MLDTATDIAEGVSTESVFSGSNKWIGITSVGGKVYAAPYDAPSMLVLPSPATQRPCFDGMEGGGKRGSDTFTHKNSGSCI